jgi:spore coat protein H
MPHPLLLAAVLCPAYLVACHPERPPGWAESTHGRDAAPAYDTLFDDSAVHRFDLTLAPDVHQAMLADLQKFTQSPPDGGPPQGQGPLTVGDPIWAPVDVSFDGATWWHVGMRYKGNSSLKSALQEGVQKLSFRLDFDKFEDQFPSIHDQRFHGFGELTFSNAFHDPSLLRDKLAADIFRRGGVPAARGAFARVYVDHGDGPVYFGLYTMIEEPSDRMLEAQFSASGGNLYKPEPMLGPDSPGATWAGFAEQDFDKKTNETSGYGDVRAVLDALHADRADPAAWREGLEAVFDVEGFLRWLAINQVIENWDSYLCIPHNYYVYADPGQGGRVAWIPWDLNEALSHGSGHCAPAGLPASVLLEEVDERRPLVRFLLDDPTYAQTYRDELLAALAGAFEVGWVQERLDRYHALIAPWVIGEQGEAAPYTFLRDAAAFETSLEGGSGTPLKAHVVARHASVRQALGL